MSYPGRAVLGKTFVGERVEPVRMDPDIAALSAALPRGWDTARHTGDNAKAARAVHAFLVKKGLR